MPLSNMVKETLFSDVRIFFYEVQYNFLEGNVLLLFKKETFNILLKTYSDFQNQGKRQFGIIYDSESPAVF